MCIGFCRWCCVALAALCVCIVVSQSRADPAPRYLWPNQTARQRATVADQVPVPLGYERVPVAPGSFAEWLRNLPLRPPATSVRLYDGRQKWSQEYHVAVIDIDTGTRDLQQCADAIMRLRAEYLLSVGRTRDIGFRDTNGKMMSYNGSEKNYAEFRRYMNRVFAYAGTYSLAKDLRSVPVSDMQIGDVFIQGGFPGHAVMVIDIAVSKSGGDKRFLLVQSFMPAQDMHILKNLKAADGSPWFAYADPAARLVTPEWIFPANSLKRFKD
jgi:hypothetical protein